MWLIRRLKEDWRRVWRAITSVVAFVSVSSDLIIRQKEMDTSGQKGRLVDKLTSDGSLILKNLKFIQAKSRRLDLLKHFWANS